MIFVGIKKLAFTIFTSPFILVGIFLIVDIAGRDFFLHKFTFEVDAEAILESHMEICRDAFILFLAASLFRFRERLNALIVPEFIPLHLILLADIIGKVFVIRLSTLSLHPLTILSIIIGLFQTILLVAAVYIIASFFKRRTAFWILQSVLVFFIFITYADSVYFTFTDTHIEPVVFSNISLASAKGVISGVDFGVAVSTAIAGTIIFVFSIWTTRSFISSVATRTQTVRLFALSALLLGVFLALNTACIAFDRDLGENFGTIYIRLEKTRQKYRDILALSPVANLVHAAFSELKGTEQSSFAKPFIPFTQEERETLTKVGLIKEKIKTVPTKPFYRNIVMIIFESLHSDFIHFNNADIPPESTQFLDQLLRDYPHLDNYFTTSIPTTLGLNSIFLSQVLFRPEFSERYHNETLFTLLDKAGLEGYFVSGVSGDHQDERRLYPKLFRLKNYIAKEEMDQRYRGASGWGYHDDIVLQEGVRVLRERKERATFLVLKLIDLHQPGEYCGVSKDKLPEAIRKTGNPVFAALYWEDKVLRNFFEDVRKEGLFTADTLIVITSDHGPYLGSQTLARPENRQNLSKIPLILVSADATPFKGLDRQRFSSQVDVAPTLLSVMGIDAPHYFLGNSIMAKTEGFALGAWENKIQYQSKKTGFSVPLTAGANATEDIQISATQKLFNNIYSEQFLTGFIELQQALPR
jgi:phosphoglycerol transferase MdoB-like AlkP superfamily enzyme